jgi:Arc/MetJ-type ribon-helix-helix transcriptional regulator
VSASDVVREAIEAWVVRQDRQSLL